MDRQEAQRLLEDGARIAGIDGSVVLPEDRYIDINGMRFHYLNWPGADAPVILFLHGGGLNAHTWDLVCLSLRNNYRCIALDQRGHGDTEWSERMEYRRDAHVRDLEVLVDSLWLGNVVLVGQSMGGLNALSFTARNPRYVRALIMVDVGPEVHVEGTRRILSFVRQDDELPSVEDFVQRAMTFNPRRHPSLLRRSLLHNLRRLDNGNWTWKYDRRPFMDGRFAERVSEDMATVWDDVRAIACPTLVVRGAESDVLDEAQAQRFAAELADGRVATVLDAGHTVQGDNALGLSVAIRDFLSESGVEPSRLAGPWPAA